MPSVAIAEEIGTAVAEEIRGHAWGITINDPVFSYADLDLKLEEASGIYLDVVPVSTGSRVEYATVSKFRHTVPIDIAIRKKLSASDRDSQTGRISTSSMSPLVKLWQQMFEFFQPSQPSNFGFQLSTVIDAAWEETQPTAIWVRKHLHEWGQYTGLIRVTFTVDRTPLT